MKTLADKTDVVSRMYYYLLDWNEDDDKETMFKLFGKHRLCDLNREEFKRLWEEATKHDTSSL